MQQLPLLWLSATVRRTYFAVVAGNPNSCDAVVFAPTAVSTARNEAGFVSVSDTATVKFFAASLALLDRSRTRSTGYVFAPPSSTVSDWFVRPLDRQLPVSTSVAEPGVDADSSLD